MDAKNKRLNKLFQILPPILTVGLVVCLAFAMKDLTVEGLLSYVPSNLWIGAAVLILLFAVKSLSIVFPLSILYLCVGLLYPRWLAVLINLAGLTLCVSIPYLIGRRYGVAFINGLGKKHPKLQTLLQMGVENEVLLSYLMRIVGVLPGDICSLFLGSCKTRYPRYLTGSLLGLAPVMIIHVFLAKAVTTGLAVGWREAMTPQLFVTLALLLAVSILSTFLFNRRARREDKAPGRADK